MKIAFAYPLWIIIMLVNLTIKVSHATVVEFIFGDMRHIGVVVVIIVNRPQAEKTKYAYKPLPADIRLLCKHRIY
jgi:hypothetical protein